MPSAPHWLGSITLEKGSVRFRGAGSNWPGFRGDAVPANRSWMSATAAPARRRRREVPRSV